MFKFGTKRIVATGIGAALFMVLFMFVKIPSWVPETQFQTAYALGSLMAVLFGPIAAALIQFIGHAASDAFQYGSPWWSWVIASGVAGFIFGLAYGRTGVEKGEFRLKGVITWNLIQIVGNLVAWLVVAPVLDIVIYAEPVNLVFTQGAVAALFGIISCGVLGTLLMFAWAKTVPKKGSLE
jgi:energy-coupling factor transport system substrate-specific component